jgi:cytosine/adenosine deaminase-related metal-dependent hydrolase
MRKIKSTIINGHEIVRNGVLVINEEGVTLDLIPENKIDFTDFEVFEGYLVPGFVNAHCHLELSHLKNKVDTHTGLVDFVIAVQQFRNTDLAEVESAMRLAENEMIENGIVAVGDISNTSNSFNLKKENNIYYHTFLEALGFTSSRSEAVMTQILQLKSQISDLNLIASISPHAPYSVSRELFQKLAAQQESVYTLHHLESLEEIMFLKEKVGDFLKLYNFFNSNIDEFLPEEKSATKYWLNNFNIEKLILVHNTFLSDDAYELISERIKNVYWCLCPNANLYIENRLPNIPALISKGAKICIGTDSLASNHQLNILSEIHTIKKHYPEISTEYLLQCASINGAEALGIEKEFGKFHIGKKNRVLRIFEASNRRKFDLSKI